MGVLISLDSPVKTESAENSIDKDSAANGSIEHVIGDDKSESNPVLSNEILENIDPLSELGNRHGSIVNYAAAVQICDTMTELSCDTAKPSNVPDDGSGSAAKPLDKTTLTAQLAKLSVSAQAQAGQVNQVNDDLERLKGQLGDLKGVIKVTDALDRNSDF